QHLMASEDLAPGTRAATEDATVDQDAGATADVALAARAVVQIAALRHLRALDGNRVAFMARLDALYRAQVAAKNREIATKDELIVELERRAKRAEQRATLLEQKLADLRAHAEVVESQPVMPAPQPGLLRRLMSWYRQL